MKAHILFSNYESKRIHLGITGSVASFKIFPIIRNLLKCGISISCTLTKGAKNFITPLSLLSIGVDPLFSDLFSDDDAFFSHLTPENTCHAQIIVPATANFIAKMAHGMADDMLSTQVLAFSKKQVIAPAMNSQMWLSKPLQDNICILQSRNIDILKPRKGTLACGEFGYGKLAHENDIFLSILKSLTQQDLANKKILISFGPTHEYYDVARYFSNPSTGLMGACLSIAAWLRGASVHVVHGPVNFWLPDDITTIPVISAQQMHNAMHDLYKNFDIIIMAAAVSDFSPIPFSKSNTKYKRDVTGNATPAICFVSNPDILASIGSHKTSKQIVVGFCAETSDLHKNALDKLIRKNCDLIVANYIGTNDSGFSSYTNHVSLVDKNRRFESWPILPKTEVAWRIYDWILHL